MKKHRAAKVQNISGLRTEENQSKIIIIIYTIASTLVFKSGAHALYHGILDLCRLVDDVKVLPTRLTHNPRVTSIFIKVQCDILPQFLEHKGASGEMKCSKTWMVDGLSDNLGRRSRNKLNDTRRNSGFRKYLMNDVV